MITRITRCIIRHYRDNHTTRAYVEWIDHKGREGRTEGDPLHSGHIWSLIFRADREGVRREFQAW